MTYLTGLVNFIIFMEPISRGYESQVSASKIKFPRFIFQNTQKGLLHVSKPFDQKGAPQAVHLNRAQWDAE